MILLLMNSLHTEASSVIFIWICCAVCCYAVWMIPTLQPIKAKNIQPLFGLLLEVTDWIFSYLMQMTSLVVVFCCISLSSDWMLVYCVVGISTNLFYEMNGIIVT